AWDNNVADPHLHIFVRQIFSELQRAVVGNSNQILVDLVVHLFEIEHYQVGYFQQFINHRIVTTNKLSLIHI
ncbi:hypothetical protein ACQ4LK_20800, partial [Bacillus pumilus]